ncbi:hypothetical protein QYF36_000557 [Acer negundo]|nr:hypothetical protein QYF36_000557 [Acer negundo]
MNTTTSDDIEVPLIHHHHHQNHPDASSSSVDGADENSPIDQVALTVPTTDDPSLPTFTFRTLTLGALPCALLSFLNQFFGYRQLHLCPDGRRPSRLLHVKDHHRQSLLQGSKMGIHSQSGSV